MEIKDVIHFYIGQKLERGGTITHALLDAAEKAAFNAYADFKPILRKLSDMTEEDGLAIFGSETKYLLYRKEARELGADLWLFTANEYTRLLKAGFDCHDLIPNGLAIDNKSL